MALSIARIDQIWPLDPNARVFFAPENPDRQALDQFEETFAKDDNLMIVVVPKGGEVFDPKVLGVIGDITDKAWRLTFVRRVDSITNFQHTYSEADDMIVRDLVENPATVTAAEAAEAKSLALERVEIVDLCVPKATDVTQVSVRFTLPQKDTLTEVPSIVAAAMELRTELEAAYGALPLQIHRSPKARGKRGGWRAACVQVRRHGDVCDDAWAGRRVCRAGPIRLRC